MAKKIMVIDDDPTIVKYLKTLFEDNGYETSVAYDGLEAEKKVKEIKPDLITLDLEMPKEWGPRFYRKMIKDDALKDIPVIVLSGQIEVKNEALEAGANAFFSKANSPDQLVKTIQKVVNT